MLPFHTPYRHGFVRAAVCIPLLRVADPAFNAEQTLVMVERAVQQHAAVALFPELGLSAYSCEDLFHQTALLDATEKALARVVEASIAWETVLLIGLPLRVEHRLKAMVP